MKPAGGSIKLAGRELIGLSDGEMRKLRGRDVGMIFQEPMTSLNPVMRISDQILETFESHRMFDAQKRMRRTFELLEEVGLPDPKHIARAFPHELSGGQRQRVMIAVALALEPKLLIADEPTTALDVTTQAQILKLVDELRHKHGTAVLFITHDFGVVAEIADDVAVLQNGLCVESGRAQDVLENPTHDYTKRLLAAVPSLTPPPPKDLSGRAGCADRAQSAQDLWRARLLQWERAEGGRGEGCGIYHQARRDARARGRIRLRQIHGRALHHAPDRA